MHESQLPASSQFPDPSLVGAHLGIGVEAAAGGQPQRRGGISLDVDGWEAWPTRRATQSTGASTTTITSA
eukprot:COSAG01_NODE_6444_length_3662_cov_7.491159_2_plen_70_part_00